MVNEIVMKYVGTLNPYKGRDALHIEQGLMKIWYDESDGRHKFEIIALLFSESTTIENIKAAVVFRGASEFKTDKELKVGDKLIWQYQNRFGIEYASEGSVPEGNYESRVVDVTYDQSSLQRLAIELEGGGTKLSATFDACG